MLNNYPIKNQNQQHKYEPLEYEEMEDLDIPFDLFGADAFMATVSDIDTYMSNKLFDMRREFKSNAKNFLKLYATKEPKLPVYKLKYTKSPKIRINRRRATA